MEITLYNCSSPSIKMAKTLTNGTTTGANVYPDGPIDVVNPIFIIDRAKVNFNHNYLVCPTLGRSYFITDIYVNSGKKAYITCHCDVLSSFATTINNTNYNFVSGAADLNMVEDPSYPLIDTFIKPIIHYEISNWNGNFSNSDNLKQFVFRTITSKARAASERHFEIGDEFTYLGKYLYQVVGGTGANDAEVEYINETTSSYPIVKQNDLIIIHDSQEYIFRAASAKEGRIEYLGPWTPDT